MKHICETTSHHVRYTVLQHNSRRTLYARQPNARANVLVAGWGSLACLFRASVMAQLMAGKTAGQGDRTTRAVSNAAAVSRPVGG